MRKINFLFLPTIWLIILSCNNNEVVEIDYGCQTSYQLQNATDMTVVVNRIYGQIIKDGKTEYLSESITVPPMEKKEIYRESEICGENTMITEFGGATLPIVLNNISIEVYANGQQINSELFNKTNWAFSANEYYKATYLIDLTDELINRVGYNE